MTLAWVVGSGGLLGSALGRSLRNLGTEVFFFGEPFCWESPIRLAAQFSAAVQAFAQQVGGTDRWEIYWAAGVGTMGSSEDQLAPEIRALSLLLEQVESAPRLMAATGALAFASSAGAIYAGAPDDVITENTPPAPTTVYAREKLRQEDLVRSFSARNCRVNILISRLSTLYGPGQATGKQQGLLAHISHSILRKQPIQIYVPYDTIRDYITADDAAVALVAALREMNGEPRVVTKIVASEHPATIAEIVSIFKRIARRAPRIVTSASKLSALYSRRVQYRSIVLANCARPPTTSLLVGISQLMMAETAAFARGPARPVLLDIRKE